ncbi:MAG: helix-turn-helix domain-containing protein [Proteobacteria bacterium]|nr:helix-turn-helix domain-containing protein [Pseudomonadota bacterium]
MTEHTDTQIILQNGKPAFAVIPWDEYQELISKNKETDHDVWIPHEVVKRVAIENTTIIKAWREYFELTQKELATKADIAQSALARLEKSNSNPRTSTLKKLAKAMGISLEQLSY